VRELGVMSRPVALTDAWAHGLTFDVGVALQPTSGLRLSAAYHHGAALAFNGDFTADLDDDFFTRDLASQGVSYPALLEGRATLRVPLPRRVLLGTAWDPLAWLGLDLELTWTTWSDVEALDVDVSAAGLAQPELGLPDTTSMRLPRRWQDTLAVTGRGRFAVLDSLALWCAAGYDSPASPDETTDMASPDGHRLVADVGVAWGVTEGLELLLDVHAERILPRRIVASRADVGNGDYRLLLLTAGVHLRWTLD